MFVSKKKYDELKTELKNALELNKNVQESYKKTTDVQNNSIDKLKAENKTLKNKLDTLEHEARSLHSIIESLDNQDKKNEILSILELDSRIAKLEKRNKQMIEDEIDKLRTQIELTKIQATKPMLITHDPYFFSLLKKRGGGGKST